MKLTHAKALHYLEKALAAAKGTPVSVAVVDAGGHLLAFVRTDKALLASVEAAQVKAQTAVFFGTETRNLPFDKPFTPALLGAVSRPFAFVPGGVPIRLDGEVVGAVGVGGGTSEQDHTIALAILQGED